MACGRRLGADASELPYLAEGGKIIAMGRDTIRNETSDLFSTVRRPSSNQASEAETAPPSRRVALPTDLPRAMRYLEDRDLDLLLRAAIDEATRRGRSPLNRNAAFAAANPGPARSAPKKAQPPGRPTHQRQMGLAASALTQG